MDDQPGRKMIAEENGDGMKRKEVEGGDQSIGMGMNAEMGNGMSHRLVEEE